MLLSSLNKALKGVGKILMAVLFTTLPFQASAAPIPDVWNVPVENPSFVGREDILKTIKSLLANPHLNTAVIYGPSGFGKSQIVKHYIYKNYPAYDIVWWFKGNQYLEPQFKNFALELSSYLNLGLEEKIHTVEHNRLIHIVKSAIRKKGLKCLIVFDDAQTYPDIEPYIPFSHEKNIHILITTKNANFSDHAIRVKAFLRHESIRYIGLFLPSEQKTAQDALANRLADCPVSIALAVDYIKNYPGMTIEAYLVRYKSEAAFSLGSLKDAADRLGSSVDGYETDLRTALKMSLEALKCSSQESFQLIGFLSLLNHDEIDVADIKKWLKTRRIDQDAVEILRAMNTYSLIEFITQKDQQKVYISMHELMQKIIGDFIPIDEKKKLIDEAADILLPSFFGRSDQIVEAVLKENTPLLHTVKVSEEAHRINYHPAALSSLRAKALDVLIFGLRDFEKSKVIADQLQSDLNHGAVLSQEDAILSNIGLAHLAAMYSPDYTKAIDYGNQAFRLIKAESEMYEEKIRLISNLIQYHAHIGNLDVCETHVKKGERLLQFSRSAAYNALFIFATTMYLIDQGDTQKVIDLVVKNKDLLDKLIVYPSIRFYILKQQAEAFIKQGNLKKAQETLKLSEKYGLAFYSNKENSFFAQLDVLQTACCLNHPQEFKNSETLIKNSLSTYSKVFHGDDKHRNQALAHLILGKLYHYNKHYDQAKTHYLISEKIFGKILQNKKIDDVSELYKMLAILGADTKDEALTHTYFKKQQSVFGLDHLKTQELVVYVDEQGLSLPL